MNLFNLINYENLVIAVLGLGFLIVVYGFRRMRIIMCGQAGAFGDIENRSVLQEKIDERMKHLFGEEEND